MHRPAESGPQAAFLYSHVILGFIPAIAFPGVFFYNAIVRK
jgi:hypothetical protein